MCPNRKCGKLYTLNLITGEQRITKCTNRWTRGSGRRATLYRCDTKLVKEIVMINGSRKVYPLKSFCYNDLKVAVKKLLLRPNFLNKCNSWRERQAPDGFLADVYDGQVWQSFFGDNGRYPEKNHLGFMLNVDWFQPFTRRSTSVGAIYLTCLNLPREERYKKENILVAGIIPAMRNGGEPSSLNPFLQPIVNDFKEFLVGINCNTADCGQQEIFAYIIGCSSDLPANRKVCGFLAHSAHKGCSRCLKDFPSMGSGTNSRIVYSGFVKSNWDKLKRNNTDHKDKACRINTLVDQIEQERQESLYGLRYSHLLELPYFDAIKFGLIDPMHNLFLGTAKKMFECWVDNGHLGPRGLATISTGIEQLKIPSDVGRMPSNITGSYSRFTAEEWKNWTLYYSLIVLDGVLNDDHLECWKTFVLACVYLCRPYVTAMDISKAEELFFKFGSKVEQLYGKTFVTPNMHMQCHLPDCVRDFGAVQSFWCFAFERFNGEISDIHTNHRGIEIQYMRNVLAWGLLAEPEIDSIVPANIIRSGRNISTRLTGSSIKLVPYWKGEFNLECLQYQSLFHLEGKDTLYAFSPEELIFLLDMYRFIYPFDDIELTSTCPAYKGIVIGGERFASMSNRRSLSSSYILSYWASDNGVIEANPESEIDPRPGRVQNFLSHTVKINNNPVTHVLASVRWYMSHPDDNAPKPLSTWKNRTVSGGPASFIPVQRIAGKCTVKVNLLERTVTVCPLQRRL